MVCDDLNIASIQYSLFGLKIPQNVISL